MLAGCALSPAKQRTVRLRGRNSEGYTWDYAMEKDEIISEVNRAFRDGSVPGAGGVPGLFLFTFEGAGEGETRVYFHYVDTTAEDEDALATIVYDVRVDPDGNIVKFEPIGSFLDVEGVERLEEILASRKSE